MFQSEVSDVLVQASTGNKVIKSTGTTTISANDSANRVLLVPDTTGAVVISLEKPGRAGVKYNIIYGGANATGNNVSIQTAEVSGKLHGVIHHISNDSGASIAARNSALANNRIVIASASQSFMLELVSISADNFIVTGNVIGATDTLFNTRS